MRFVKSSHMAALRGKAVILSNDAHSRAWRSKIISSNQKDFNPPAKLTPKAATHDSNLSQPSLPKRSPGPQKPPPPLKFSSLTPFPTLRLTQIMPSKRPIPPSTRGIKPSSSNTASSASESLSSAYRALTAKENRSVVWSVSLFGVSGCVVVDPNFLFHAQQISVPIMLANLLMCFDCLGRCGFFQQ